MSDVLIPAAVVPTVTSAECDTWLLDHTSRGVVGHRDEQGRFVLTFDDHQEAAAFRRRWLGDASAGGQPLHSEEDKRQGGDDRKIQ